MCKNHNKIIELQNETQGRYILKLIKEHNLGIPIEWTEELPNIQLASRPALPNQTYWRYTPLKLQYNSRPFCIEMVGYNKVFSESEISFLTKELGYDVLTYAGGWNCKHEWTPYYANRIYTPPPTPNQMRVLTQEGMPYKDDNY